MIWVGLITLVTLVGISLSIHSRLARLRNRLTKGRKRLDDLVARLGSSPGNADLEAQLTSTKSAYNDSVLLYNASIEVFPSNCVASLFRFHAVEPVA